MNKMIKEQEQGNLIVLSGPSGAGKDSIINELKNYYHNFWVSISMTSRKPRGQEVDGIDYFFVSKEEFERHIKKNDFLEYAIYNDNYYGTPKSKIEDFLHQGKDVILEIEIQGALKIKEEFPNAIFIFIMPPSMPELIRRLKKRNTENTDKIIERFKKAYQEINYYSNYNYVVINDDLDTAVKKVEAILTAERLRVSRIENVYVGNAEEALHEVLRDDVEFINHVKKIDGSNE